MDVPRCIGRGPHSPFDCTQQRPFQGQTAFVARRRLRLPKRSQRASWPHL